MKANEINVNKAVKLKSGLRSIKTYDSVLAVYQRLYRQPLHTNQNLYLIDLDRKLEYQVNCDVEHSAI